jgi:four helix bundle protein
MSSFRELKVWQLSMEMVTEVYKVSESFPKQEVYGLTSQIRRCSISIPSNIAEGSSRHNTKEFIQFLYIANGSLSEFETQIEIAFRLGYCKDIVRFIDSIKQIRSMLSGLINVLKDKDRTQTKK